jgi:hypothetical protein
MNRASLLVAVSLLILAGCGDETDGDKPPSDTAEADATGSSSSNDDAHSCRGIPVSCTSLTSSATCGAQAGCSAAASCAGAASACHSQNSAVACEDVSGCDWSGSCEGWATSCDYYSSYSCAYQQGCYWSTYYNKCAGYASSCYGLWGEYSCSSQDGCYWDSYCEGSATACATLTQSGCNNQPGCSWDLDCNGTARACSSFALSVTCEAQDGCYWD